MRKVIAFSVSAIFAFKTPASKALHRVIKAALLLVLCMTITFSASAEEDTNGAADYIGDMRPAKMVLEDAARVLRSKSISSAGGISPTAGWETIFEDDFEGSWPGPWIVTDQDTTSGSDYWGRVTCKPGGEVSGSYSVWCAAEGDKTDCGSSYDYYMYSWMVYGPFSLTDYTNGEIDFYYVNESEPGYDYFFFGVAIDGANFYGYLHTGTTPGYPNTWQNYVIDLTNVYELGNVCGESQVWLAFVFAADNINSNYRGAYIDDVTIRGYTEPEPTGEIHGSKWNDLNGDGNWDGGEPGLSNWKIFIDENLNGQWDSGEPYDWTDSSGNYSFTDLPAGTYTIGEVLQDDWVQTYPAPPEVATLEEVNLLVSQITTTGSTVPIFTDGEVVEPEPNQILPLTAQSGPLINMDEFRADPRFSWVDGGGYTAVILDTGIDLDHPYFGPDNDSNGVADRIVYHHDFADNDDDASDHDGHGSNVSSIVGSQDSTNTGMAPGADIIHLKVFTDGGAGNFSYVEQALQWVVNNAATYNIVSINMSLGDSENWTTAGSHYGIGDELAALEAMGIIVVCSSGNNFFTFGSQQGVGYPSADSSSLSIGAVYDAATGGWTYSSGAIAYSSGADRIAPFSQRHATLTTVFAPGAVITGANQSGGTVDYHGTSQASPHIAGIALLAQQLAENRLGRRLTMQEYAVLLRNTAVTVNDGDDEDDNVTNTGLNFPRVDMLALAEGIVALGAHGTHTVVLAPGQVVNDIDFGNRSVETPPEAYDSSVTTFIDTPVMITLQASDDGRPDPPAELTYTIISLPSHGDLNEPGVGPITEPCTPLVSNLVEYMPDIGYVGEDSFTFAANDGGTAPEGGASNEATVYVRVTPCILFDDFPSTTLDSGNWPSTSGTPTVDGTAGNEPSPPYSLHLESTDSVTSKMIDLYGCWSAHLEFWWKRAGTESGDDLYIDYWDGNEWVLLYTLPAGGDTEWEPDYVELPDAALHSEFYLRFRADCDSSSDEWYIDDVCIQCQCCVEPPFLHPEPNSSWDSSCVISWDSTAYAEAYYAERATDSDFNNTDANSGWIADLDCEFSGLIPGQKYWYHVKAWTPFLPKMWLQTSQADFETDTLIDTETTSEGDVVLRSDIGTPVIDIVGGTSSSITNYNYLNCFYVPTETALNKIEVYLRILSSRAIEFVVYEGGSSFSDPYNRIHISTLAHSGTGTKFYSSGSIYVPLEEDTYYLIGAIYNGSARTYYNAGFDSPSFGDHAGYGFHNGFPSPTTITNISSSGFAFYHRYTSGMTINFDGDIVSTPISLPTDGDWQMVNFDTTIPADTALSFDILPAAGSTPIPGYENVSDGTDLSGISNPNIRLRANLFTSEVNSTPILHDWSVSYIDPGLACESDWSNSESTFQCGAPGDFEPDCDVDWYDLQFFADYWLNDCNDFDDWCYGCDLDYSGAVNFNDFAVLGEYWLEGD